MKSLRQHANFILHAKIKRLAEKEYIKANPSPLKPGRSPKPYTLPACVDEMVKMLGRVEIATDEELEAMAFYATTGEVFELTTKTS